MLGSYTTKWTGAHAGLPFKRPSHSLALQHWWMPPPTQSELRPYTVSISLYRAVSALYVSI
eukprot:7060406-Prymnesium_polylepis.1